MKKILLLVAVLLFLSGCASGGNTNATRQDASPSVNQSVESPPKEDAPSDPATASTESPQAQADFVGAEVVLPTTEGDLKELFLDDSAVKGLVPTSQLADDSPAITEGPAEFRYEGTVEPAECKVVVAFDQLPSLHPYGPVAWHGAKIWNSDSGMLGFPTEIVQERIWLMADAEEALSTFTELSDVAQSCSSYKMTGAGKKKGTRISYTNVLADQTNKYILWVSASGPPSASMLTVNGNQLVELKYMSFGAENPGDAITKLPQVAKLARERASGTP